MMNESFRILVPIDGSEFSEKVFPWVRFLHTALPEVEISLLRCYQQNEHGPGPDHDDEAARSYLRQKADELGVPGVVLLTRPGEPCQAIQAAAETADLVVMAAHARAGFERWLTSGVATRSARGCSTPVLLVGEGSLKAGRPPTLRRLMVAFDGSPEAELAVSLASRLARPLGAMLQLYQGVAHVGTAHQLPQMDTHSDLKDALATLRQRARALQVEAGFEAREVWSSDGILEYAEQIQADLIVMGCHSDHGLARRLWGGRVEHLVNSAPCPVLVAH